VVPNSGSHSHYSLSRIAFNLSNAAKHFSLGPRSGMESKVHGTVKARVSHPLAILLNNYIVALGGFPRVEHSVSLDFASLIAFGGLIREDRVIFDQFYTNYLYFMHCNFYLKFVMGELIHFSVYIYISSLLNKFMGA
jgi:hypothetical protein